MSSNIISMQGKFSDTMKTRFGTVKQRGICIDCGEPTYRHHTADYCNACAKEHNLEYYRKRSEVKRNAKSN